MNRFIIWLAFWLAGPALGMGPDPMQYNPRGQSLRRDAYRLDPRVQERAKEQYHRQHQKPMSRGSQGQFRAQPTDAELAEVIGLDPQTGEVSSSLFTFELDTVGAYVESTQSAKLGISGTVLSLANKQDNTGFRLSLDLFQDFIGGSLNYIFEGTFRPGLGLGWGTVLGSERDALKRAGESVYSFYVDFRFRLW